MQNLYSDESYVSIDRQLKRRLVLLFAVLAVLLGVFFWAMIARIEWLAVLSACLAGCFGIFFADLFCTPLVRYRRLVRSAVSGRSPTLQRRNRSFMTQNKSSRSELRGFFSAP